MKNISLYFETKLKSFNLKDEQKLQLIELLLLIGTLSAAFNLEKDWIWLYMIFALMSIFYFIIIQKPYHSKDQLKTISLISFFVAVSFSGLLTGNLFISLPKAVLSPPLSIFYSIAVLVFFTLYYIAFCMILWAALKKYDKLDY